MASIGCLEHWEAVGRALNVTLLSALQSFAEVELDRYLKTIPR